MKNNKPNTAEEWLETIHPLLVSIDKKPERKNLSLADHDLIDTDGVCKLLNVTASMVANYRKSGEPRFSKRGGRHYYLISDIRDMMMKGFNRE